MINGIKPIVAKSTPTPKKPSTNGLSFDEAMDTLLVKIQENYDERGGYKGTLDLTLKPGRKFIKVVEGTRVWGFVSLVPSGNTITVISNVGRTDGQTSQGDIRENTVTVID